MESPSLKSPSKLASTINAKPQAFIVLSCNIGIKSGIGRSVSLISKDGFKLCSDNLYYRNKKMFQ